MKKLHWLSLIMGILSFSTLVFVFLLYPPVAKTFVQDVLEYFEDNKVIETSTLSFESQGAYDDIKQRLNIGELKLRNINWLFYFLCSGGY